MLGDVVGPVNGEFMATEMRVLGPVQVRAGDREVPLPSRQLRTVLAALVLSPGRRIGSGRLIDLLWDREPPPNANAQVQVLISRLRRGLAGDGGAGPRVHLRGGGYELDPRGATIDVEVCLAHAETGRRALAEGRAIDAERVLQVALDQWRGVSLGDVTESLRLQEEPGLAELHRVVRTDLAQARVAQGRPADALPELRRLLSEQPTSERVAALLIEALGRCNRLAEASEAYHAMRHRLAAEYGIDPGTELTEAYRATLRTRAGERPASGAPAPPAHLLPGEASASNTTKGHQAAEAVPSGDASLGHASVPQQLPRAVTRLVGREPQLSAILAALRPRDGAGPAVVAIHGPGGVGKSALAVAAGHGSAHSFPHGQLYIDLQGSSVALAPLAVADVVGRFLRAFGVAAAQVPATEAEAVALYRTLIAHRRVLIIADNASSAEQVGALLPATPGSALIATSRHVLGMLDGAIHVDLGPLSEGDARNLLTYIAGSGRVETEPEAFATLVRTCGCMPLALRIVGSRLVSHPHWTVADLAGRLADEKRVLHELNAEDGNLRASLQLSWRELRADDDAIGALAARIFLALGAVRLPTVSFGLAAALCTAAPEAVEQALDRLVAVRLLERGRGHFRMHDLVRLFATELAAADPERQERLRAALSWYASAANQVGRLMRGMNRAAAEQPAIVLITEFTDAPSAGAWLDHERANLVAITRQALVDSHAVSRLAGELVLALYPAILMRGHAYEWEVLCRLVVDAADRIQEPRLVATALTRLAVTMAIQLRIEEALECLDRGLSLHRLSGDRSGEASALETAGMLYTRAGRAEEALSYFEHALRLRSELGERYAEGITLSNAAEAYHRLGRDQEALHCLDRSLEIRHEFGDLAGAAITQLNQGEVFAKLGMVGDALRTADAAIDCSRRAGDRESERRSLDLRARLRIMAGDIEAALIDCESVLDLAGTPGNGADLDELISALESAGQNVFAGRLRRRTARNGSF